MTRELQSNEVVGRPTTAALFLSFLGVGLSGFGGVLPFARRMLVEKRGWLTTTEFNETLALCQALPGPNIVNVAVVVGARFAGLGGSAAAFLGLMGAPVAIVLALAAIYDRYGETGPAAHFIAGLGAAACGLVAATAFKMAYPFVRQRAAASLILIGLTFVAIVGLQISLVWVVLVLGPIGFALAWRGAAKAAAQ
ncbi:MAG TPA: chromate transporter [Caulobacteraceae bacterium]|jgi:chromate transporter